MGAGTLWSPADRQLRASHAARNRWGDICAGQWRATLEVNAMSHDLMAGRAKGFAAHQTCPRQHTFAHNTDALRTRGIGVTRCRCGHTPNIERVRIGSGPWGVATTHTQTVCARRRRNVSPQQAMRDCGRTLLSTLTKISFWSSVLDLNDMTSSGSSTLCLFGRTALPIFLKFLIGSKERSADISSSKF